MTASMDTGLLNLGEEHFSSNFDIFDEYFSADDSNRDFAEWDAEREINGDIALIPVSSDVCGSFTNDNASDFFSRIPDWSSFINIDVVEFDDLNRANHLSELISPEQKEKEPLIDIKSPDNNLDDFDLTNYITKPEPQKPIIKAPVKKIDLKAQKYIIDDPRDDIIDVETVTDETSLPVLEATDAISLLEQFEASERPNLTITAPLLEKEPPVDIFEDAKPLPKPQTPIKSKQIIDALPEELIARINESGKRKPITVIPPIPNKKRRGHDEQKNLKKLVQNDHDYCSTVPYPKHPKKDSGFGSAEEDERAIIRKQPMVKNADGKLMVSLLKVNTIINTQKKKLNLEEYKKRRFGSNTTSQSNSPASSTCSSPLPEDENIRRIKHQEKLMKMAAELLKTPPPSKMEKKEEEIVPKEEPAVVKTEVSEVKKLVPPPDMEMKTYISVGTNTTLSSKNKDLLASVEQLVEIKPLLEKVSDKITSSSFITSLIENIPKVKDISERLVETEKCEIETVREGKTIQFLKKDRPVIKTSSVGVQTRITLVDEKMQSRYRRRLERSPCSSVSSTSSSSSYRRKRSRSSSSSRSSRSRSRSNSSKRSRYQEEERMRQVEERRVVYVGRIAKGTSKEDLRRRFHRFGPIINVSLHFRERGDNYGFVTYANKQDAYDAVEHGNDGYYFPKYDLSFGGRRIFCKTSYSDLDDMREDGYGYYPPKPSDNSFDALLREFQEKLIKRKS